jgi:hypothetical protein
MTSIRLALSALLASSFLAGCAVDTGALAETTASESDAFSLPTKPSPRTLVGSWLADRGNVTRLELTEEPAQTFGGGIGRKFTATVDTGIRCITTPCPAFVDVTGVYIVRGSIVSLNAFDRPSPEFARVLGDYRFAVTRGVLTLTNMVEGSIKVTFRRAPVESCVTYESDVTDVTGTTGERAFYAINVPSKEAGEAMLAHRGRIGGNVTAGKCDEPLFCTREYNPVCGTPVSATASTFGNLCTFKSAVRMAAGSTGEFKGTWAAGACRVACTADSDCTDGFCSVAFGEGQRVCRPYVYENERCGGFTTPDTQSACSPSPVEGRGTLTCVYTDPTFDEPGTCRFQ